MMLKRILSRVVGWFVRKNAEDTTEGENLWLLQPKQICQRRLTIIFEKLPFEIRGMVWEFALGFGRDVKNIIKTMSVSQTAKDDICRFCLKKIDISTFDFHKSLGMLRTLVRLNDSIESLTFRSNWKEFLLILYWLQSRNVISNLRKLRVLYAEYNGLLQTWSVVHDLHRREDNTIDLTDETVVLKTPTDTTSTDFVQFMENNQELVRSKKLQVYFDFPALRHLKFPFPSSGGIFDCISSLNLRSLELNIWKSQENRSQNNFPDATELIDQLKFLRELRLTRSTVDSPGLILIKSNSVKLIDLRQAGKALSIRLDTPKLQKLHISDSLYGNGIRRLDPASNFSEIIWTEIQFEEKENKKSIPTAHNIWFSYEDSQEFTTNNNDEDSGDDWKWTSPVSIPDNCLVIFHRY